LADVALAGRVIASHYAEPLERSIAMATPLRADPSADATVVRELQPGEPFAMLDDSLGWAWGYGGNERRVGYVRTDALGGQ
jgi:Bacterial dipeptidyl-peptidase Sh3 domain